jgi:type II secretory pathway component HofQ
LVVDIMTNQTHKPASVAMARRASDAAWAAYQAAADLAEADCARLRLDSHTQEQVDNLNHLRKSAIEAERHYRQLLDSASRLAAIRRAMVIDAENAINVEDEPVSPDFDPDDDPADDEYKQQSANERADWLMQAYPNLN